MSTLAIVEGKRRFCGPMARYMRIEHHAALLKMKVEVHREIRRVFDSSFYRRAAFVDGHLAAMWGVTGSAASAHGMLWLVLGQHAVKHPAMIFRQAKRELEHLASTKRLLATTLIPDDEASARFVIALGFESPDGFGGGRARSRSGRGNLLRYVRNNHELMVDAGSARQVAMIWQPET